MKVADVLVGGEGFVVIAGPCAVESCDQIVQAARSVARAGASMLRGGVFKPRSSPYSFQGLGRAGLDLLARAGRLTGLPTVTEVMSPAEVSVVARFANVLQVGARSMQNFELLRSLGQAQRPILLKRGLVATVDEFLMAAEYIVRHGNPDVMLCERGIRTFETATRNTLDLGSVALLKRLTHLPVLVDPSHGTGRADLVRPLALAAVAAGADGLIVEVHPCPAEALSDGAQSLDPEAFVALMHDLHACVPVFGRRLSRGVCDSATEGFVALQRQRIDRIDHAIVALLSARIAVARQIGKAKSTLRRPVQSPEREEAVLSHVALLTEGELDAEAICRIYMAIIAESRHCQSDNAHDCPIPQEAVSDTA